MTYVIPSGYSRVSFEYDPVSSLGSKVTWGFGCNSAPDIGVLGTISTWYEDEYKPACSSSYVLRRISMRSDTDIQENLVFIPGDFDGQANSPNVCALVQITTGLTGRANRGRIYLPGLLLDADVLTDGSIESSALSSVQALMVSLGAALATVDTTAVVLHSTVGTPTPATGLVVSTFTATQRRRLRR